MSKWIIPILLVIFSSSAAWSQSVYKTPSGKKYHLSTCRMVENVSEKLTVEEAIASGLEPCKICKPPVQTEVKQGPDKQQGQNDTVQCKGTTKAGTRCRHKTRIANGYCYQHQKFKSAKQ